MKRSLRQCSHGFKQIDEISYAKLTVLGLYTKMREGCAFSLRANCAQNAKLCCRIALCRIWVWPGPSLGHCWSASKSIFSPVKAGFPNSMAQRATTFPNIEHANCAQNARESHKSSHHRDGTLNQEDSAKRRRAKYRCVSIGTQSVYNPM